MTPLEREMCAKVRVGDEKAFDMLFKAYYSSLCYYAFDIVRDTEAAKEIVLDLFLKIWDTKESFTVTSSLKGYLYRSIHNLCLNYIRDRKNSRKVDFVSLDDEKNRAQLISLEVPPEIIEQLFTEQLEADLKKALETLPEQCRAIFCLCRFDNLTYPEIAEKLDLALSTVKTQMLRAISKLESELSKINIKK